MAVSITPAGARILVEPIIPIDEDQVRAAQSNLVLVRYERSKPRPTTGYVIAVGNDPIIQEVCAVGDMVYFSMHAGVDLNVEGKRIKSLEVHEIITVLRGTREELEKVNNPLGGEPSSS